MLWIKEYEEKRKEYIEQGYCEYDATKLAYAEMRKRRNARLEKEGKEKNG